MRFVAASSSRARTVGAAVIGAGVVFEPSFSNVAGTSAVLRPEAEIQAGTAWTDGGAGRCARLGEGSHKAVCVVRLAGVVGRAVGRVATVIDRVARRFGFARPVTAPAVV